MKIEPSVEFLCVLEGSYEEWTSILVWLEEGKQRRAAIIQPKIDPISHPRVVWRSMDSPLQIEPVAKLTALDAVFLKIGVIGKENEWSQIFQKELEKFHRAAHFLLLDSADWGVNLAKHCFARGGKPVREGLKLKGAFLNIPALIVGAGASLEMAQNDLERLRNQALIFAGGHSLTMLKQEPHFAGLIDQSSWGAMGRDLLFGRSTLCFQSRMHPEHFSKFLGEVILFPDTHFSFLQEGDRFEGGWTVTTFLTAVATWMGCNPIVFVGMDGCYRDGRKYAGGDICSSDNLVQVEAKDKSMVWTQPDWLMARDWIEEWAKKHPQTQFLDASYKGIGFGPGVAGVFLKNLSFPSRLDLFQEVRDALSRRPYAPPMDWEEWERSLKQCSQIIQSALYGAEENYEGQWAYEFLLEPLWTLWGGVFSRALQEDCHPEKVKLNRILFFQQVIDQHLSALCC